MKEPPRGQFEKEHVLHEVIEEERPAPISMEAAFARLKRIATIRTVLVAFCALGFGLFSQATLSSLYLDNDLHVTNVLHRGIILTLSGVGALPLLPFVGKYFDRVYRKDPAKALAVVGLLILPSAIFTPLQFSIHSTTWFVILGIPQAVLTTSAFAMVGPVLYAVVPYRLRGMGTALTTMYIFFIGGFLGGIIAGFFTNAIGIRDTVIVLGVPTSIIGGLLLMNGARFIRHDLSLVVSELLEEQEEHHKRAEEAARSSRSSRWRTSTSPTARCRCCSTSNFEVRRGETLALLGTNGAGKSTILRVISGLEVPERGVVRLNGQNITYVTPEARARLGIIQLPGRQGGLPQPHRRPEPRHQRPAPRTDRARGRNGGCDYVFDLLPELEPIRRPGRGQALGRPAADAGSGARPSPRTRDPPHRRAVAGPRARRRRTTARDRRTPQERGPDDGDRRAVVERGPVDRRPGHLPGQGLGPLRGSGPRSARARRPRPGRVLRHRGRLSRVARPSSPRTCCSSAPSGG